MNDDKKPDNKIPLEGALKSYPFRDFANDYSLWIRTRPKDWQSISRDIIQGNLAFRLNCPQNLRGLRAQMILEAEKALSEHPSNILSQLIAELPFDPRPSRIDTITIEQMNHALDNIAAKLGGVPTKQALSTIAMCLEELARRSPPSTEPIFFQE